MEMLDAITVALKQAGFQYVTLDCAGFRSGAMNEILGSSILSVDVLAKRGTARTV
jgi:uncharacterized protein